MTGSIFIDGTYKILDGRYGFSDINKFYIDDIKRNKTIILPEKEEHELIKKQLKKADVLLIQWRDDKYYHNFAWKIGYAKALGKKVIIWKMYTHDIPYELTIMVDAIYDYSINIELTHLLTLKNIKKIFYKKFINK